MVNKLKNISFLKAKSITGIRIKISPEGKCIFDFVKLVKTKSILNKQDEKIELESIDELIEKIDKKSPISISVEGKGVIYKKIENAETLTDQQIIVNLLPNAVASNFYIQKRIVENNEIFVAVVRKQVIDEMIDTFQKNNLHIIDLTFGPFSLQNIVDLLNKPFEKYQLANSIVTVKNKTITNIIRTDESVDTTYEIGGGKLDQHTLLPYASAIKYFLPSETEETQLVPKIGLMLENFIYKQLFRVAFKAVLILFFCILLLNFLLFDLANNKLKILSEQYNQNEYLLNMITELSSSLEQKEQFVVQNGFLKPSKLFFYADRLAHLLPENIRLTKLDINPLRKKIKKRQVIDFNTYRINVAGITNYGISLNDWIDIIKKEEWISNINILFYNKEKDMRSGEFEIEIEIIEL